MGDFIIRRLNGSTANCITLSRFELVQICEDNDILPEPPMERRIPSILEMRRLVIERYNLTPDQVAEIDEDQLECYFEWSRVPRGEICRMLYQGTRGESDSY